MALNDREVSGVLKKNNLYFSDDQICAGSKIDKDAHYNLVFEYKTLYVSSKIQQTKIAVTKI